MQGRVLRAWLLLVACLWGGSVAAALLARQLPPAAPVGEEGETAWVCPMHPGFTAPVAGKCEQCGMALVFSTPYDVRDYRLEFQTVPAVVRAGEQATLRFRVFHPGTGELVKSFQPVHDR